jgi:predicted unusual protein kinase regulating ubiquinone biosynthesis (AarF/ABC1/UbiB family)
MEKRGIAPGSPESQLAGRRILTQLTDAFGRMILGAGFIHGDPHPGNIFIQEGGRVALIDCGQVWSGGGGYFSLIYSPHPGNIFIQEGGRVALIDCGQVWSGGGGYFSLI